jgi:hypothetical protein
MRKSDLPGACVPGLWSVEAVNDVNINCVCAGATDDVEMVREPDGQIPLHEFTTLREKCLALREILVPEELWPQFRAWHAFPDTIGSHSSVVLLAFRRGLLHRVTAPIHRHLMCPTGILSTVSMQYVKDLREKWMFDEDPLERHRLARIAVGKPRKTGRMRTSA